MVHRNDDNNHNAHPNPPELIANHDILASTSLKDFEDKDTLLQNIGYLRGIRVDNNDGPRSLTRRVAKFVGAEPPFVQEINSLLTETITTKTERETNYIHCGWSIGATSTITPWTSSRIASNNQPNAEGTWLTRRTLIQRLGVRMSLEDLAPDPEFKTEIEAALSKPSVCQQFEAVYRALHNWGDVVLLEVEMGDSLAFTDLEMNMSQLPTTAKWVDTYYLTTIRTARTTRQDAPNNHYWENDVWRSSTIPPLHWRQIRVIKVVATTRLLPVKLQNQLSQLYVKRLSYIPAITIGPADSPCRTQDDTPYASREVSSVALYSSDFIRTMKFVYADKSSSIKHEGTERAGSEHTFVLTNGEYITEMLIWGGDWVYGLQFVTNLGRCSPHFGGSGHTPSMARSKGGILVGVISLVKQNESGRLFHKIQGIWRHDVIDKVPKEDDVFSDYFGSKTAGRSFNDRVVVRNSEMAISKIEVRCGNVIDSLQFTYIDNTAQGQNEYQTERHGGLGGTKKDFVLKPGEYVVSVSGKYDNERITQMSFVTNKGRPSEAFGAGISNKDSPHSFLSSPEDKEGNCMRLQYVCGKSGGHLNGIMFIWTPL